MDTWVLVLGAAVVIFLGWRYWKRIKRAGERAVAVSKYAAQFSRLDCGRLHDMALTYLATSVQQDRDPNQDLEIVVALRDRVDELEQRTHGPANKARIRTSLVSTATQLFKETNPLKALSIVRPFVLGEDTPDIEHQRLNLHLQMMQRVYQYLDRAPRLPELDEYTGRQ